MLDDYDYDSSPKFLLSVGVEETWFPVLPRIIFYLDLVLLDGHVVLSSMPLNKAA